MLESNHHPLLGSFSNSYYNPIPISPYSLDTSYRICYHNLLSLQNKYTHPAQAKSCTNTVIGQGCQAKRGGNLSEKAKKEPKKTKN